MGASESHGRAATGAKQNTTTTIPATVGSQTKLILSPRRGPRFRKKYSPAGSWPFIHSNARFVCPSRPRGFLRSEQPGEGHTRGHVMPAAARTTNAIQLSSPASLSASLDGLLIIRAQRRNLTPPAAAAQVASGRRYAKRCLVHPTQPAPAPLSAPQSQPLGSVAPAGHFRDQATGRLRDRAVGGRL